MNSRHKSLYQKNLVLELVACKIEKFGHHVHHDELKILDRESHWFWKGIKEAINLKINRAQQGRRPATKFHAGVYEPILICQG